jgi:hypothetical protein
MGRSCRPVRFPAPGEIARIGRTRSNAQPTCTGLSWYRFQPQAGRTTTTTRLASRYLFDIAVGLDIILDGDKYKLSSRDGGEPGQLTCVVQLSFYLQRYPLCFATGDNRNDWVPFLGGMNSAVRRIGTAVSSIRSGAGIRTPFCRYAENNRSRQRLYRAERLVACRQRSGHHP